MMTFISFAQNFEDVILRRAMGAVPTGFYIDAGANDPDQHSVTRAFYDAGWHGINIEPVPLFLNRLVQKRPRDINLGIGLSDAPGTMQFSVIEDTGLGTGDHAIADSHKERGWQVEPIEIEVNTLASVCERYAPDDIHFLKIDVEGMELAVLQGADFTRWRPWVVLVEATAPLTQELTHQAWEPVLLEAGYTFAYWDGLNRFYVAHERAALLGSFTSPPNVFDDFILADSIQLRQETEHVRAAAATAADAAHKATEAAYAELAQVRSAQAALEHALASVHESTSWRLTQPVRVLGRLIRRPSYVFDIVARIRDAAKNMFRRSAR